MTRANWIDSNYRRPSQTTRGRYPRRGPRRRRVRVRQDSRSNTFIPSHENIMGASFLPETVDRLACDIRRPPPFMVLAKLPDCTNYKLDKQSKPGAVASKTVTISAFVQFKISRTYGAYYVAGLEYTIAESDHHLQYRHDMYDLGYSDIDCQDAADCARQGSVRCPLLCE